MYIFAKNANSIIARLIACGMGVSGNQVAGGVYQYVSPWACGCFSDIP